MFRNDIIFIFNNIFMSFDTNGNIDMEELWPTTIRDFRSYFNNKKTFIVGYENEWNSLLYFYY